MVLNTGYGVVSFMLILMVFNCMAEVAVRRGMPEPFILSVGRWDGEGPWNSSGNGSTFVPDSNGNTDSRERRTTTPISFPDLVGMFGDQPEDHGQDEVVRMTVRNVAFPSASDDDSSGMPGSVELSFNYANQLVVINLTRNENIPSHLPVFYNNSVQDSSAVDSSEFHDYAFYFDPKSMSSVLIEKVFDASINSNVFLYSGSFFLNGVEFGFEPVTQPSSARRRARRSVHPNKIDRARREATPGDQLQTVYQKNQIPPDVVEIWNEPYLENRFNGSIDPDLHFDIPAVKPAYLVQILAVIDYRLFTRWYNFSKASTVSAKTIDAYNNIRFYFGHVFNGVDMRYRSINDSAFSISTSLVGIYVAMKPSDSSFVENNRVNGIVDANTALNDFTNWLYYNQGLLPQHNQATLFTSDSMLGPTGDRISGLAIIMGMCTRYSVALCKDAGEFSTTQTTAHEIGHNLGAGHDGVGTNLCNAADQYIMSANPGLLDDNNYKKSFHFSSCSISEFRSFLTSLSMSTSAADHCLVPTNGATNVSLAINLTQEAGQRYTPDDQCVLMLGSGSYYCGGKSEDANICRSMECFSPVTRYCYATYEQRAFTGTTCGNHSWCQEGDCVVNPKAPLSVKTECIYGDYKGPYTNGLSCSLIISSAPYNCYDPAYYDDCCQGCPAIRNSSRIGCEFGDHQGSCYTMGLSGCYDDTVRNACCDRCQHYATNIPGCEYGDKAEWCPSYIMSAIDCYSYASTCCDSCRKYDIGLAGCLYGDRAGWCSTVSAAFCYTTAADCCYSCSLAYNASAVGCEYGDKADWCLGRQGFQCYIDADICCATCQNFITSIPDCQYGDKIELCQDNFHPSDCYSWSAYCCATCSGYFIGISGCEYGDRVENCSSSDCLNSERQGDCCFTCSGLTTMLLQNTTASSATTTLSSATTFMFPSTTTSTTTTALSSTTTTMTLPSTITTTSTTTTKIPSTTTTTTIPSTTPTTSTTTTVIPSTATTTTLPSTITTPSTTTTTISSATTTTTTLPSTSATAMSSTLTTTTLSSLLSTPSSTTLKSSPSTFSPNSEASSSVTSISSTRSQPQTTMKPTVICTAEGDKASYCSSMSARDCYVLADTCCQTCQQAYVPANGCEYGNRAGWCDSYLTNRAGCLQDDNAFWCCQTCATVYGVQCSDSVNWCSSIRPWDCYDDLFQATLCCATCRQMRRGNYAGCEYGDQASWCGNYPLGFICTTSRSQCCMTCQGWQ